MFRVREPQDETGGKMAAPPPSPGPGKRGPSSLSWRPPTWFAPHTRPAEPSKQWRRLILALSLDAHPPLLGSVPHPWEERGW